MKRIRLLGEAVGRWVNEFAADERVLVIGTGGLSHDPPVPRWGTATDQQRAFLLEGRNPTPPEARAARQERTITTGQKFAKGGGRHHGPQSRMGPGVPGDLRQR